MAFLFSKKSLKNIWLYIKCIYLWYMKDVKAKNKDQKKLLDIPTDALKILAKMANEERMSVKAYMEKVLIDYANSNKK